MTDETTLTEEQRLKYVAWLKAKLQWFETPEFAQKWFEYLDRSKREIVTIEDMAKHFDMPVHLAQVCFQENKHLQTDAKPTPNDLQKAN